MKHVLLFAIVSLLLPPLYGQTTAKIFVVRHADRTQADDLSPAGLVRAKELKRVLLGSGIKRIFSTNTVRTQKTANPLAVALGLTTTLYASNANLITTIKNTGANQRHLVVGHSDTVIDFITSCGCIAPEGLAAGIPATQFDNLFLVLLKKTMVAQLPVWSCEVIRMRYGAVTN